MRQREKLTRYAINRLKGLMAREIKLIRVYPYESHANDIIASVHYSDCEIQKDSFLYKRLLDIRRIAENFNMSDNKIVIQVEVNYDGCRDFLFLGYWDSNYSIGTSVRPCLYAPKEFPCNNGWVGMNVKFLKPGLTRFLKYYLQTKQLSNMDREKREEKISLSIMSAIIYAGMSQSAKDNGYGIINAVGQARELLNEITKQTK